MCQCKMTQILRNGICARTAGQFLNFKHQTFLWGDPALDLSPSGLMVMSFIIYNCSKDAVFVKTFHFFKIAPLRGLNI